MQTAAKTLGVVMLLSGCGRQSLPHHASAHGSTIPANTLYQVLQSPMRRGPADAPVVFAEIIGICDECATLDSQVSEIVQRFPEHLAVVPIRMDSGKSRRAQQLLAAFPCANERHVTPSYLRWAAAAASGVVSWKRFADDLPPVQKSAFLLCAVRMIGDTGAVLAESALARSWGVRDAPSLFVNGTEIALPVSSRALNSIVAKALDRLQSN
jgi:hypothetical protein